MRVLVQSQSTGRFLVPSLIDGQPEWVASLREAGGGVLSDPEAAFQLVQDHCEPEDLPQLVDLDRLGTAADYGVATASPLLRSGCGEAEAAPLALPDGNHGENKLGPRR